MLFKGTNLKLVDKCLRYIMHSIVVIANDIVL